MSNILEIREQYYPIFCHIAYWHQFYHDKELTQVMIRAFASTLSVIKNVSPYMASKLMHDMYNDIAENYDTYVERTESLSNFAEIPKSPLTDEELEQKLDTCFSAIVGYIIDAKDKSKNISINDEPIKVMLETVELIGILNPQYRIYIPHPSEYMEKYFMKYYDIVYQPEKQEAEKKVRHEIDGIVFYTIEQ